MHKLNALAAGAIALLGLAAAPAQAGSSATATASFSDITITLVDLDLNDGITPWINFNVGGNNGSASASFSNTTGGASQSGSYFAASNVWAANQTSVSTLYSNATAGLTGNGSAAGSTLSASGQASGAGTSSGTCSIYQGCSSNTPSASFSASAGLPYAYNYGGATFTLSANTLLAISATVDLNATALGGNLYSYIEYPGYFYSNGNSASAYAGLSINGSTGSGTGAGYQSSSDARSLNAYSYFDQSTMSWYTSTSGNGSLGNNLVGVSFVNQGDASLTGNFSMSVNVNGYAYGDVTAVPEPGAWALMLSGLMALGFMARRRRLG